MKVIADYHTHTVYSHGTGSIEDNVKVALEKGLKVLAISDHGPGHLFYGIKRYKYIEMRNEIDRLNKLYPQIKILLSLEANFLSIDGSIDMHDEMYELADIVMCGYHFGSKPRSFFKDLKIHLYAILSKYSKSVYEKSKKINTEMVINAINKNDIVAITHPGAKGPIDVIAVSNAAALNDVALEINSKHGHLTVDEIKEALKTDVKFILGSDAHSPENVGDCSLAIERCELAGVPSNRIVNVEA